VTAIRPGSAVSALPRIAPQKHTQKGIDMAERYPIRRPAEQPSGKPTECPYCQSRAVSTLAREVTDSTCWRCQACGGSWTKAQIAALGHRSRR